MFDFKWSSKVLRWLPTPRWPLPEWKTSSFIQYSPFCSHNLLFRWSVSCQIPARFTELHPQNLLCFFSPPRKQIFVCKNCSPWPFLAVFNAAGVTFNNTKSIITKIFNTHTRKAEAVCKQKQRNKQQLNCQLSVFDFLLWIFVWLFCLFSPQSTCSAAVWPEVGPTHFLWRATRRTWRCHWPQSPPHLKLTSLHHIILSVQPLLRPQLLISGTFCLFRTVFSSSSENMRILLPFRSTLVLQAVTFGHLSMAAIQGEWFSLGSSPFCTYYLVCIDSRLTSCSFMAQ